MVSHLTGSVLLIQKCSNVQTLHNIIVIFPVLNIHSATFYTFIYYTLEILIIPITGHSSVQQHTSALSAGHVPVQSPQESCVHHEGAHPPTAWTIQTPTLKPEVLKCEMQNF